jgi:hypothetical protein
MTMWKEGEWMKYQEDGRVFKITKITPDFVVLRALDDSTQILTGTSSLGFWFEKLPPLILGKSNPAESRPATDFRRLAERKQQPDPALIPRDWFSLKREHLGEKENDHLRTS